MVDDVYSAKSFIKENVINSKDLIIEREKTLLIKANELADLFQSMSNNEIDRQLILVEIHYLTYEFTNSEIIRILSNIQYNYCGNKAICFSACYALSYFNNDDVSQIEDIFAGLLCLFLIDKNTLISSTAKSIYDNIANDNIRDYLCEKNTQIRDNNALYSFVKNYQERKNEYAF